MEKQVYVVRTNRRCGDAYVDGPTLRVLAISAFEARRQVEELGADLYVKKAELVCDAGPGPSLHGVGPEPFPPPLSAHWAEYIGRRVEELAERRERAVENSLEVLRGGVTIAEERFAELSRRVEVLEQTGTAAGSEKLFNFTKNRFESHRDDVRRELERFEEKLTQLRRHTSTLADACEKQAVAAEERLQLLEFGGKRVAVQETMTAPAEGTSRPLVEALNEENARLTAANSNIEAENVMLRAECERQQADLVAFRAQVGAAMEAVTASVTELRAEHAVEVAELSTLREHCAEITTELDRHGIARVATPGEAPYTLRQQRVAALARRYTWADFDAKRSSSLLESESSALAAISVEVAAAGFSVGPPQLRVSTLIATLTALRAELAKLHSDSDEMKAQAIVLAQEWGGLTKQLEARDEMEARLRESSAKLWAERDAAVERVAALEAQLAEVTVVARQALSAETAPVAPDEAEPSLSDVAEAERLIPARRLPALGQRVSVLWSDPPGYVGGTRRYGWVQKLMAPGYDHDFTFICTSDGIEYRVGGKYGGIWSPA